MVATRTTKLILIALGASALACFGSAQRGGIEPGNEQMNFESNLGAMRLYNANGDLKITFKGTVLVRGYKATMSVTDGLNKEYEGNGRVVYHGAGTLTMNGHWDSLQWFGQDMQGEWNGRGGFRLYGDYDKNLDTGWWWVDGDKAHKLPWPTQSPNYTLPYRHKQASQPLTIQPKGH